MTLKERREALLRVKRAKNGFLAPQNHSLSPLQDNPFLVVPGKDYSTSQEATPQMEGPLTEEEFNTQKIANEPGLETKNPFLDWMPSTHLAGAVVAMFSPKGVKAFSEAAKSDFTKALSKSSTSQPFRHLPQSSKQELLDRLYSDDKGMLNVKGKIPDNEDVYSKGLHITMQPSQFLEMAPDRAKGRFQPWRASKDAKNVVEKLQNGTPYRMSPGILKFDISGDGLKVVSHEGRHRSDMITQLVDDDVQMPVGIYINGVSRDKIKDYFNAPITGEDGNALPYTLEDLIK